MPRLSIITINYNNATGLQKTVASVITQSFKDFEYIIIDGNSSDASVDVIKKNENYFAYWCSEKDKGIYDAQNKGIQKAKGDYLLFLNSGDCLENDGVLENVFSLSPKEDVLYGELIFDFGTHKKLSNLPSRLTIDYLFRDNIWHPASFIKRNLFEKYGNYDTSYKICADYDFFFKTIAIHKVSTLHLTFPISIYDTTGLSSNEQSLKKIDAERMQIHKHYLKEDEYAYFDNLSRFKIKSISKFLVNKPFFTSFFNKMLQLYSKLRN